MADIGRNCCGGTDAAAFAANVAAAARNRTLG